MGELFSSRRRQPVILKFAITIFGHFPLGGEPPFALHAVQSGIERAVFDLKDIHGGPLDVLRDLMPVSWAEKKSTEDKHV